MIFVFMVELKLQFEVQLNSFLVCAIQLYKISGH